ncbi:MAG: nitrous oxide reductase family maturation protein NosD [Candidatus Lokiarchaeia archaeon]
MAGLVMRGFRSKGIKAVVLVSVLLLVPAFSFIAVQNNGQNSLVYQMLLPYVNSPGGQPIAKADLVWGDVTFSNTSSYSGVEIVLNGNLTVASGGVLTLTNVTLMVNCSSDGQHRIEVQSGGALYINDTDGDPTTKGDASNITAYNPSYSYLFWVDSGAAFQMNNSEVRYCGYWNWPFTDRDDMGLWINTNDTIIENNTFSNNHIGLILVYAHHSSIRNNNFTDNDGGLDMDYSSDNTVISNTAKGGWLGGFTLWRSSDNILMGNTAEDFDWGFMLDWVSTTNNTLVGNVAMNNAAGFEITRGANHNNLTGNFAINNTNDIFADYGFYINSSSDNNLTGNTAVNSEYGFFVNASSSNNDLFGNDAVNCSVVGYFLGAGCVGNDLSGSVVSNFLRIRVVDSAGVGVGGVDVRVASGGVDVYASPGYGGGNESTGVDGLTAWITVPYQRYSGVTSSALVVEVWVMGYGHRVVDMSTSHTETFKETNLLPLVFFAASQGSQGIPSVLIVGGLVGVALIGCVLAVYMLRRRG